MLTVDGKKVAEGRVEQTVYIRFSLDESVDIGEDTGSPVIDEYDAKMPFRFTGTLKKVEIKLGADELTPKQRAALLRLRKDEAMRGASTNGGCQKIGDRAKGQVRARIDIDRSDCGK